MKISELGRVTGLSTPTIKYYLREGLLPGGTPTTAPNQADYGERHLHRLRLIRALVEVGGLSLASVRSVLSAIDDEALPVHDLLGVAHRALPPSPDETAVRADVEQARRDIDRYLEQLGWDAPVEASPRLILANALVSLRRLGRTVGPEVFEPYARLADRLAAQEVASVPTNSPRAEMVEAVVVGTVVFEAALTALRRLAQAHHSARRFGGASSPS